MFSQTTSTTFNPREVTRCHHQYFYMSWRSLLEDFDETVKDLQYGDQLTPDQRRQLEEIASSYSSIFSYRPGTVFTEEHRI
ncbi:hypothetical protein ElyMa_005805200 [Elysia marginata]|uniref:Uncharacterized protein n=1 Tax=Elysia marginata TaxID=1093978 RepID=A0AAV4FT60_9GAST|nr:hypothetical protein ElyMa_005805200 [Elysia marginata]